LKGRLVLVSGALAMLAALAAAAAPGSAGADRSAAIDRAVANVQSHDALTHFGAGQALSARDVIVDGNGVEHVRFDRTYKGLRVLGGDLVVHTAASGDLVGVSQTLSSDLGLATTPTLSPGQAVSRAGGGGRAELVVYARGAAPQLAYEVSNPGLENEPYTIVDAHSGALLDSWDGVENATGTGNGFFNGTVTLQTSQLNGTTYRLQDSTRGNTFTCDMRNRRINCYYLDDADNVWGDGTLANPQSVAVDAQYGTNQTWDYYKTVHGRLGIRGDGSGSYNRVHYSRNYNNASWSDSCFCMTYGDGDGQTYNPFDSLDVAGHEMSHGVTSATANLTYSGESGGLNEGNSDIFGTMVEYFAANAKDTPDYKIGEKLYKSNPGETKALRYMWNPAKDGASANCWSNSVGSLNVHYSSGVANHFFYLLAEGSAPSATNANEGSPTCNGSSVTGIGRDAAQRIWYRGLTVYMTSSTNYHGARTATLNAAADLYGAGSAQVNAVNAAWAAVSVS
jgi:Zn-dependent metalloprotease